MKTKLKLIVLCHLLFAICVSAHAQGTAFTYQGRLNAGANPANGIYDLRFAIFDLASGGSQVGPILTNSPTAVTNGLFTVTLDFSNQFSGADRWLEIGVRTNGAASFSALIPRQKLTPAPYAIFASTASNVSGTISAANLSGTYGNAVTFNNAGNSFTGNGSGLTALNAGSLTSGTVPSDALDNAWKTTGNAGTTPDAQFIGTSDNQPLELRVNGKRALRIEPEASDSPNLIGGSPVNFVAPGVNGSFIGGGGSTNFASALSNRIASSFSVIGGGNENVIATSSTYSFIGAGQKNTIQEGIHSAIAGGQLNTMTNATWSVIGGGFDNRIDGAEGAIVGGLFNKIVSQNDGFIGGGGLNQLGATNFAGGSTVTTNSFNTIVGGLHNLITAGAFSSFIGGGRHNSITNSVSFAAIPGGLDNVAGGDYAFAAGRRAKARHDGTFVWADSTDADFASTGANQFLIRASGGARFSDDTPELAFGATTRQMISLHSGGYGIGVQGGTLYQRAATRFSWFKGGTHSDVQNDPGAGGTVLMTLLSSGLTVNGTFVSASDRNAKENFSAVDTLAVLAKVAALPLAQWNYKADEDKTRHLGPMAQDFYAAFGVGPDDKHIATVDADGVALAAIQGLNQKLEEKEGRIKELESRLDKLEQLMNQKNGGAK